MRAVGRALLAAAMVLGTAGPALAAPRAPKPTITIAAESTSVRVRADFPTTRFGPLPRLRLYRSFQKAKGFEAVGRAKRSRPTGVVIFTHPVRDRTMWLKVCREPRQGRPRVCTKAKTVPSRPAPGTETPGAVVPTAPPDAVVVEAASAAHFTARFEGGAAADGRAAELQVQPLVTAMTRDVTDATWRTLVTAQQTVTGGVGSVVFTVPDPLEIPHRYRVVTGQSGQYVSNEVTVAAAVGAKDTGLPQVYLNTNEGDPVISRLRYLEARFSASASSVYPECAALDERLAVVRGRGNSTWGWPKKPYNLKLDKKADICGLGKSKKWALLANYFDRSLLRNAAAAYVGSQMPGLVWTPQGRPVDLWLNGEYRGTYLLVERIAAEGTKRVPYEPADDNRGYATAETAPSTPGFLLEWDFRAGGDRNIVTDSGTVAIKDPEDDFDEGGVNTGLGITDAQVDYISAYVNECDRKDFAAGQWRDCIDAESAVDYYLAMELLRSIDGNMKASVYMWKPAQGTLRLGPLWDFDIAAGSTSVNGLHDPTGWEFRDAGGLITRSWFTRLTEDPAFWALVRARWAQVRDDVAGVDAFLATEATRMGPAAAENYRLWDIRQQLGQFHVLQGTWDAEVTYLRDWLRARIAWMDGELGP